MNSTEIAKLARVSRSTVSRVVNGYSNISEKTRKRVEAVIREQNYVPDVAARNLVGKANKMLGLFIIDMADQDDEFTACRSLFYYDCLICALEIANRNGYDILVTIIRPENVGDIERLFVSKTISGGVIMGDTLDETTSARLLSGQYKLVLYNQMPASPNPNIITVNYDNFRCGKLAGRELLRHGHTRIAHITGGENRFAPTERMRGLLAAMREAKVPFDAGRYLERGSFHRESGGYDAVKRLLKRTTDAPPTAICCGSASMMIGASQAIYKMGLRIPEDISLIGIDGTDLAKYTSPGLSEVTISRKKVAVTAFTKLIELLEQGALEQRNYKISETKLVVRGSILSLA